MDENEGREAITPDQPDESLEAANRQLDTAIRQAGNPLDPTGDERDPVDDIDYEALAPPTPTEQLLADIANPWPRVFANASEGPAIETNPSLRFGPVPTGEQWVIERLAVAGKSAGAMDWTVLVVGPGLVSTMDNAWRNLLDVGQLTGSTRAAIVTADGASAIVLRPGDYLAVVAIGPGAGDQVTGNAQIRIERAS